MNSVFRTLRAHLFSLPFIRFVIVGVINTLTTFFAYTVLTRSATFFHEHYLIADTIGYGCGTIVSFLLNRRWTFRQVTRIHPAEVVRFYTTMVSGLVFNIFILYTLVDIFGVYDLISVALALACTMLWNFALMKLWVFTGAAPHATPKQKMLVVFSGRFPSEKADSLFAHENAVAFAGEGIETLVLAPRRLGRGEIGAQPYRTVYLPTIDLTRIPYVWEIAAFVNLVVFSCALLVWLIAHADDTDLVLCNEPLQLLFASFALKNILYEVHIAPARHKWFYRAVFARARLALPINNYNARLAESFGVLHGNILVARSAVDTATFRPMDRRMAREKLGLPLEQKIAMYTGHLFGWKGVDTLAETARLCPDMSVYFVGGTAQDVARFKAAYSDVPNVRVVGFVPHADIPLWQAAADVLVIPNSAATLISVHYTSPMKLFEYMASQRPILASDLPSIREILSERTGYFAEADDAHSFAKALAAIFADPEEAARRAHEARAYAEEHTWEKRARRILDACRALGV